MDGVSVIYFSTVLYRKYKAIDRPTCTQAHVNMNTKSGEDEFVSMSGTDEICTTCYGCLILQVVLVYAAVVSLM